MPGWLKSFPEWAVLIVLAISIWSIAILRELRRIAYYLHELKEHFVPPNDDDVSV
jgi:hypothetical protein